MGGGKGFLFADQAGSATVKDLSQQKIKKKINIKPAPTLNYG